MNKVVNFLEISLEGKFSVEGQIVNTFGLSVVHSVTTAKRFL
jgi:hypothetical protein